MERIIKTNWTAGANCGACVNRTPAEGFDPAGFTLIEVLVAMAVIAILAAIALPSYTEYVNRGRRAEGRTALSQALQQQERFFAANNRYSVFSDAAPNGFMTSSGEDPGSAHYALSAAACAGSTQDQCVVISAVPSGMAAPARGSQFIDTRCGTLTLSTAGVQTPAACWQ